MICVYLILSGFSIFIGLLEFMWYVEKEVPIKSLFNTPIKLMFPAFGISYLFFKLLSKKLF